MDQIESISEESETNNNKYKQPIENKEVIYEKYRENSLATSSSVDCLNTEPNDKIIDEFKDNKNLVIDSVSPSKSNEDKDQNKMQQKIIKRLKREIRLLQKIILGFLAVSLIDILFIFLFKNVFSDIFNYLATGIIVSLLLFCLFHFKLKLTVINREVYKMIVRIFYANIIATIIFYADTIYILIARMLLNSKVDYSGSLFLWIILILFYLGLHFTFPVLIVVQIIKIRLTVKTYGYYEGKDYSFINTNIQNNKMFEKVELQVEAGIEKEN